jgi:hypothetical protein
MNQVEESGFLVKYAVLHGGIYIPGSGNVGPTLSLDATNSKVSKMRVVGAVLIITAKDPNGNVIKDKAVVPLTNVTHYIPA